MKWGTILFHFARFPKFEQCYHVFFHFLYLMLSYRLKKEVLPLIHSLCQDVNYEVRACICSQLHYVARSLDAETVKPALLPSLVELASDEESHVRLEAVETIVNMLPTLQAGWCLIFKPLHTMNQLNQVSILELNLSQQKRLSLC